MLLQSNKDNRPLFTLKDSHRGFSMLFLVVTTENAELCVLYVIKYIIEYSDLVPKKQTCLDPMCNNQQLTDL